MILSKVAETSTTITLGWTPPANVDMYAFYAAGKRVSTGNFSFKDGTLRNTVRFSKGSEPYEVVALIRSSSYSVVAAKYPAAPIYPTLSRYPSEVVA